MKAAAFIARSLAVALLAAAGLSAPRLSLAHPAIEQQIRRLDRDISAAPERTDLVLRRAELFRRHGQLFEALEDLDTLERLAPGTANLAYYRARLFRDMQRHDEALPLIERHIAEAPGNPEAYFLLSQIHRERGYIDQSIDAHEKGLLLETRPSPDRYIELATAHQSIGDNNAALEAVERGMRKLGPIVALQLAALRIEMQSGMFDAALERVDSLKSTGVQEESRLVWRARVLSLSGRPHEAYEAYELAGKILSAQPERRRSTPANRQLSAEIERSLANAFEPPPSPEDMP